MKVVSVLHFPEYGGPHNQMLRLAGPLLEREIESLAVLPEGPGAARLQEGGVETEIIELGRFRAVRDLRVQARMVARFPVDMWQLIRLFRREKPDVVQLSGLMNPHAAIAARLLGIPVVWQLLDTRPPMPIRRVMMRPIRRLSDVLMPIGYQVAKAHPGAESFKERMVVFYPPVDTALFRPRRTEDRPLRIELGIAEDAPLVGVIGNINPQKGHEFFIDAAAKVRLIHTDVKFVIAGHIYTNHRSYYDSLRERARRAGLEPERDIFFLGSRSDVPNILASFDVLALASVPNSEGTPTVIVEAMAAGVPVVATNVGSVSEVVADSMTGYLVPSMDVPAMVEALDRLLIDRRLARSLGESARARVLREFSLDTCIEAHVHAYNLAIAHRKSKRKFRTRSS